MSADPPKEKRRNKRISIVKEIEVDGSRGRRATDLSVDGMYIDTLTPFAVGSIVELRFRLDDADDSVLGPIATKAKVLYAQEGLGIGVQFIDLRHDDQIRIRGLIEKI